MRAPIVSASSMFVRKVIEVKALDWDIAMRFDNGEIRTIDFTTLKYPVVELLLSDKVAFQNVEVSSGGIRWPDLDVDLDPDDLYDSSEAVDLSDFLKKAV